MRNSRSSFDVVSEAIFVFQLLGRQVSYVFHSLTSDALVSSENGRSTCRNRCNLIKKEVPDPVLETDVIGLSDVGLLTEMLG